MGKMLIGVIGRERLPCSMCGRGGRDCPEPKCGPHRQVGRLPTRMQSSVSTVPLLSAFGLALLRTIIKGPSQVPAVAPAPDFVSSPLARPGTHGWIELRGQLLGPY